MPIYSPASVEPGQLQGLDPADGTSAHHPFACQRPVNVCASGKRGWDFTIQAFFK